MDNGHWSYEGEPFNIEDYHGFIYEIRNVKTNRSYIGKKSFWSNRTLKPLKGKKRNRKVTKESDWKTYCSSQDALKANIKTDEGQYTFSILKLCRTKRELTYQESKHLWLNNVLEDETYLNQNIDGKYFKGNLV